MAQVFKKPSEIKSMFGVGRDFLRRAAEAGELPEGAVLCTPGNHHLYDPDLIRQWMQGNFEKLTRTKRMEAKARSAYGG